MPDGTTVGAPLYLRPWPVSLGQRCYWVVGFVPEDAVRFRLRSLRRGGRLHVGAIRFRAVGGPSAALLLAGQYPRRFARMLRSVPPSSNWRHGLRRVIGFLANTNNTPNTLDAYRDWVRLFDTWQPRDVADLAALVAGNASAAALRDGLEFLVLHREAGPGLAKTLASIAAQAAPAPRRAMAGGTPLGQALAGSTAAYVAILQAGEVVPAHATLLAAWQLAALGHPDIAYADEDAVTPGGTRHDPLFRPEPSHALMMSGTLSRGLWLVRRDVLLAEPGLDTGWAETLRLDLWLRQDERRVARFGRERPPSSPAAQGAPWHFTWRDDGTRRIPYILTHRRPEAEAAPPDALAGLVNRHLAGLGWPMQAAPCFPVKVAVRPDAVLPGTVSMIVPSALRAPHVPRCAAAVLAGTDHPAFELVVGVSQPGPLDPDQERVAEGIRADARARVALVPAARFNFSAVNNVLARQTQGEFLLLLNDDVSPIDPGWLRQMLGQFADPRVGVVGAKLLYPDRTVQHGGVLMGLSGLCDHMHRYLPGDQPGYAGRAMLTQELSVVTAACLLVRRTVFEEAGGLDETYPSAFNDVDFCLRVRDAGHAVVWCAQAELFHHEMLTYGSHYSGDRAGFERLEVQRMRTRWAAVRAADPFHNPNLDLTNGQEWRPAFPPRLDAT